MDIYKFVILLILTGACVQPQEKRHYENQNYYTYTGDSLRNIGVPVGGFGTGNVLIGGRGDIRALEIFNRANVGGDPPYMIFFSMWWQEGDNLASARILEGEIPEDYPGPYGVSRRQLSGLPRFEKASFTCKYPFINLQLSDGTIPLEIELESFNPFIPLDIEGSSLPIAVFTWSLKNTSTERIQASIAFNMGNPLKNSHDGIISHNGNRNTYYQSEKIKGVLFENNASPDSHWTGNCLISTDYSNSDAQSHWYAGAWWDDANLFWEDFAEDGKLDEQKDTIVWEGSSWYGSNDQTIVGSVVAQIDLEPGESTEVPFYFSWYIPNRILESSMSFGNRDVVNAPMKNYYSTQFTSSEDVLNTYLKDKDELYDNTKKYTGALFNSTLPVYAIDAIAANTASLKSNLLMRTEKGWVHGFEGLSDNSGCCPGNCEHVWNYEQTMASLFPSMERKVRETSFLHDTFDNGFQCFRSVFPLSDNWFRSVAPDAQMGNIIRVYREWKYSGDNEWLRKLWPKIQAALEFAWKGSGNVEGKYAWQNQAKIPWDPNKEGVIRGRQHNTYDIDFFGPNMMTGSCYLGALKACSEMAEVMGEPEKAVEYMGMYESGRKKYEELLWNGTYFKQHVEVVDGITIPERLKSPPDINGKVWPKYQFGEGCLSDQLLGQYLAFNASMGYILDENMVSTALGSVFKNNFIPDFSNYSNIQRVFAINNEGGLITCTWPGADRPKLPFVYCDEVWTGIEYQVAASLIYSGLVEEGLKITETTRNRYKGYNRNPWAEIESGYYYARAMASWSLLPALSGYEYDGVKGKIGFDPRVNKSDFSAFWSCGSGWGEYRQDESTARLELLFGSLNISSFKYSEFYTSGITDVKLNGKNIDFRDDNGTIRFSNGMNMNNGDLLSISFN
ncbi:GH116 family glycosyl-hydrolase [Bacteroidota bacterium]